MNSEQAEISIIVTVYNSENYIRRCLDSIRNQTFKNFEVILIDDGSKDKSGEICDSYAVIDSRFKVIHKFNGGVASAKQHGIDTARGRYVIHIDSDDWIDNNMLELLYTNIKISNSDICCCNIIFEYKNYDKITHFDKKLDNVNNGYLANKLIKKDLYTFHNIRFNINQKIWEDLDIILKLNQVNPKCTFIDDALYHYDQFSNTNSLSRVNKDFEDVKLCIENAQKFEYYNKHKVFYDDLLLGVANEDSLNLNRSDFMKIYQNMIIKLLLTKGDIRKKLNIISIALGFHHITRLIYKLIRETYRKVNYNVR